MEKLFDLKREILIECDNCDFVISNEDPDNPKDGIEYVNVNCPQCGKNLLTVDDYMMNQKVINIINWFNKWFSWITLFYPFNSKSKHAEIKIHNGIKIKEK